MIKYSTVLVLCQHQKNYTFKPFCLMLEIRIHNHMRTTTPILMNTNGILDHLIVLHYPLLQKSKLLYRFDLDGASAAQASKRNQTNAYIKFYTYTRDSEARKKLLLHSFYGKGSF